MRRDGDAPLPRKAYPNRMKYRKTGFLRNPYSIGAVLSVLAGSTVAATTETELEPVIVSAHGGMEIPYDNTGVSVSLLDAQQERTAGRYHAEEALKTVPGVSIAAGGQRGNVANIAIRGMSSGTCTLPMVDGMRIYNSAGSGNLTPNLLAQANMFDLSGMEILRGAEGAVYGNGAMGGVLYMETPEGDGTPTCSLFNEGGSFDTYTGNVTYRGRVGNTAFFLSSTAEHTNNDLRYADGTEPTAKHAGRYTNFAQAVRLDQYIEEDTKLTFTYRREDADYRYFSPDPYYGGITPYSFRTNLVSAKLNSRMNERWTTNFTAGYFGSDSMFGHGTNYNTRNVQLEWRNAYRWNDRHTTTAGMSWTRSDYSCRNNGSRSPYDGLENIYGVFAEHMFAPTEKWNNSLALRVDESNVYDTHFTARFSSSYRFAQDRARVFGSVGTGYRAPGALERSSSVVSAYGYTYHGNPDLECEKSFSADFGAEYEWTKGHRIGITAFGEQRYDAISEDYSRYPDVYFCNSPGSWKIIGTELTAEGTFGNTGAVGYKAAYTLTRPEATGGRQIPYTCRQVASAQLYTTLTEGLTTGIELSYAAGRIYSARADRYCTLRWYAEYEVNPHLKFHLRVENLTDEKYTVEQGYAGWGYTVPDLLNAGMGIYAGCTLTF